MAMATPWGMLRLAVAAMAHMAVTFVAVSKHQWLVDLDSDLMNHVDFCKRANRWFVPGATVRGVMTVLFFLTGHWVVGLCALPLDALHAYKYWTDTYKYDPTEIGARKNLSVAKREAFYVMIYQAAFFVFLFLALISLGVLEFTRHPVVQLTVMKQMFPWTS